MGSDLKKIYRTVMDDSFPSEISISFGDQRLVYKKRTWRIADSSGELVEKGLRYGENPGQEAALYEQVNGNLVLGDCRFIDPNKGIVSAITTEDMIQAGKHPGKTNLTDMDNAINILKYLVDGPASVIVKHNNPCGVAYGATIFDAYQKANTADRIAAFGGCAVFNRPIDTETAELISENYLEVVAAPEYEEGVVETLSKRVNLRIVRIDSIADLSYYRNSRFVDFKSLTDGGIIVQQSPLNRIETAADFMPASSEFKGQRYEIERRPSNDDYDDMLFGWQVEQGITSNSVIYVKDGVTKGIGTGEQDRVGVAEIAVFKAYTKHADTACYQKHGVPYKDLELKVKEGKRDQSLLDEIDQNTRKAKGGLIGATMVSDAFFPFRDGVDVGIKEGISAIVQPGGSMRDYEVIQACNEADPQVTMVFTGQRAFKH